jgi:hypothetical protein
MKNVKKKKLDQRFQLVNAASITNFGKNIQQVWAFRTA